MAERVSSQIMMAEQASRNVNGAKESSITSEGGADKDKDIDSHSNKSSEDKKKKNALWAECGDSLCPPDKLPRGQGQRRQ